VENDYTYTPEQPSHVKRNLILVIVAIVIIVAGGLTIFHFVNKKSPTTGCSTNCGQTASSPNKASKTPAVLAPKSQTSSPSTSTPAPKPAPTTSAPAPTPTASNSTTNSTANTTSLTNTGPGDDLAVFLGFSVVGALAFHLYQRRHVSSNR
jgi:hypothetical protein